MSFVAFVNGIVLMFLAGLMGVDAVLFPETRPVFTTAFVLTGIVGAMLAVAASAASPALNRLHTFVLTTSIWLVAALAGALPLYLWSLPPVDALFEAMSGITTTGSTVMTGLDSTPRGILLWRALLQAVGGVGFIVTGIALLPILKVGGMQLFRTESSDKGEKELGNATQFAFATLVVYIGLMGLCGLIYAEGGMSIFDATTHAMTTLSTGGYSNYDASFGHFDSAFLQWTGTVFMLLGALPFAWYIRAINRNIFRSEQVLGLLKGLAVAILGLSLWLTLNSETEFLDALRLVAFNVVSVVTTTGFASADYTEWGPFAVTSFFLLTAVGGCTGSTAGGAKTMRWIILYRSLRSQIRSVHSPSGIFSTKYEGQTVGDDVASGVIAFFTLYFATFAVLAMALGLVGLDFLSAVSGALTALANVGPGVGDTIGPAGNFATIGDDAKLIFVAGMYLGRLEMMTVFILFTRTFWREV